MEIAAVHKDTVSHGSSPSILQPQSSSQEPQSKRVNDYSDERQNKGGRKNLNPVILDNHQREKQWQKPSYQVSFSESGFQFVGQKPQDKILIVTIVRWQMSSTKPDSLHASLCLFFFWIPLFCYLKRELGTFFSKQLFSLFS